MCDYSNKSNREQVKEHMQDGRVLKMHVDQSRGCAPGGWTVRGWSLPHSQALLPCEVLCPLSDSNLSSHIPGSSFPSTSKVEIHTQKSRQNQIHSPSCVSRDTSPAQILYRKFPLLLKNSRSLCTTLLLKIWSLGSPAFSSSNLWLLGSPSLSVPLAPPQLLVG